MKNTFIKLFALVVIILGAAVSQATVIVQNTGGTTSVTEYVGESFQTPSDFLYYNLTFNFYSNFPATTPTAGGTAFLLSQPYVGTPSALSMTTPGFLTESTSSAGGVFTFNPNFVLLTSTEYYLYTNASLTFTGANTVPNENAYVAAGSNFNFAQSALAANFSLNGTKVGTPLVPEPSSQEAVYVLSGVVGLGFVVMRRRRWPLA